MTFNFLIKTFADENFIVRAYDNQGNFFQFNGIGAVIASDTGQIKTIIPSGLDTGTYSLHLLPLKQEIILKNNQTPFSIKRPAPTIDFSIYSSSDFSVNSPAFCPGDSIIVPIEVQGLIQSEDSLFFQLSDELGSFNDYQILNRLGGSNKDTIRRVLPDSLSSEGNYRVRVNFSDSKFCDPFNSYF